MLFLEIIKGHETVVITASAALLGVFLTAVINVFQKWLDMRHAKKMKIIEFVIEFEKKQLLEPVLCFLDSDLAAMREVYGLIFVDKKDRDCVKIENKHLTQLPSVEARIKGLGDDLIYEKFNEFSRKRLMIGNAIDNPNKDPFKELESAIEIAGDVMSLLLQRSKRIKN